MYSSCLGYMPSKKQSNLNLSDSVPHKFSLQRSYSKSTIPTGSLTNILSSPLKMSPSSNSFDTNHSGSQFTSRTQSIMSFVYTLGGPRLNQTPEICKNLTSSKSKHNCKELVVHYNNMPSTPLVSSHLIGGFVGSKSQLGRTQGFEVKMWDIIRDLLSLVGSSPSTGKSFPKSSPIDKRYCGNLISSEKRDSLMKEVESKDVEAEKPRKQSYAEVTKSKLPVSNVDLNRQTTPNKPCMNLGMPSKMKDSVKRSAPTSKVISVIETVSKCNLQSISQNRDRITSECSADSEDSFIVFENCESDIHVPDDISNSSDDENCHFNGEHSPENRSATSSTSTCGKSTKKVRFAEGKELRKVHSMIMWDYAYRKARAGPWEMLARDSERFRCRIANTEAILRPVLDQQHREAVYQHSEYLNDFADRDHKTILLQQHG